MPDRNAPRMAQSPICARSFACSRSPSSAPARSSRMLPSAVAAVTSVSAAPNSSAASSCRPCKAAMHADPNITSTHQAGPRFGGRLAGTASVHGAPALVLARDQEHDRQGRCESRTGKPRPRGTRPARSPAPGRRRQTAVRPSTRSNPDSLCSSLAARSTSPDARKLASASSCATPRLIAERSRRRRSSAAHPPACIVAGLTGRPRRTPRPAAAFALRRRR